MRIRQATNKDAPEIARLIETVLCEYGLTFDPEQTDADLDDIEACYLARGGIFEVVEDDDGAIIGSVGLYPLSATDCELRKMYLARSARGQGLGKALIERMIEQAREQGYGRMVLETSSRLTLAIALYRQYGFTPYEPEHLASRCDQAWELAL